MIRLSDIAGYMSERAVWQLIADLAAAGRGGKSSPVGASPATIVYNDDDGEFGITSAGSGEKATAFVAPEGGDAVWAIGAIAFYAVMGVGVFEGTGGAGQRADTVVPRIGGAHCGEQLSRLIYRCLAYDPATRPALGEVEQEAREGVARDYVAPKRLSAAGGKGYVRSLVNFWPDEMVPLLIAILLTLACSGRALAQAPASVPDEMKSIIARCEKMRSRANVSSVTHDFQLDMKWTLMDEIAVDRNGECTDRDPVTMFGLNDIGYRIAKKHGGVTNAGGRFRNGQDPRYKFSFIEITVKKGATVSYDISGRKGEQLFAVVPYEAAAAFALTATLAGKPIGEASSDKGVAYLNINRKLTPTEHFKLKIENRSGKNMSFVIINYNSRN